MDRSSVRILVFSGLLKGLCTFHIPTIKIINKFLRHRMYHGSIDYDCNASPIMKGIKAFPLYPNAYLSQLITATFLSVMTFHSLERATATLLYGWILQQRSMKFRRRRTEDELLNDQTVFGYERINGRDSEKGSRTWAV
ncbi:hypothetical protein LOAG_03585 [Loa loa]|uniref:Uncharacterized protein n=1 Tax=Loa loa TaxID=7209 RepID=A0A1S0U4W2_LOALO|nr:hypothetical protein LOAG_03585 [Loa loa]EFO24895.1 hypothetical protein LOAG_03585 [Loa loa]